MPYIQISFLCTGLAEDQAKQEKGEKIEVEAPKDADEEGKDTEGEQTSQGLSLYMGFFSFH